MSNRNTNQPEQPRTPANSAEHGRTTTIPTWPRGLSRIHAASYVGLGPSFFDKQVAQGLFPTARRIGRRLLWDRHALDSALDKFFDCADQQDEIVLQ
jgi:predicted DNA-binding transcriptional regulator AlpA